MDRRFLCFENFRLDRGSGELFRDDRPVRLAPQPTKLLLLLTRRSGALVTHEEIQKELWGEDTFVDFEQAIKRCVKQVRAVLGDEAESPVYVETVPRRGYRFIGRLDEGEGRESSPYPGLSAFLEKDAPFFFGREREVEALWSKVERRKLLALIGASGAGKTSFVQAGILPCLPEGWRVAIGTPGSSALSSLPMADSERGPMLLVVDAFEELFTRNPPDVQKEFSERLAGLARENDVHVLLSMRDDFLIRCQEQESLREVFFDLTPLGPLSNRALRQAVEEPAVRCGYRFEEGLVEEMLQEVERERGALPLLAFACAQLWERRDGEKKLLTRGAYEEIGRVGGALAQHAERTLQSLGGAGESTVRELFRNLTTSHGTRASVKREELLSVFPDREAAASVLTRLIDARLVTSSSGEVEIVHESLLSAWPKLVQWRAQEAEGTVFRDQLRQAAKLWEERGRTEDLLWTGTAFRDFTIWRERYSGGLTETEEEFAAAARKLAGRRRRQNQAAMASVIAILLGVVATVTSLWRQSVLEVARREAAQILALGRLELEDQPTSALAHALASLERADSEEARRFAVETLWHGAPAFILPENVLSMDFSPDGRWLATDGQRGAGVRLWSIDGGPPKIVTEPDGVASVAFSPTGEFLAVGGEPTVSFWSLRTEGELRSVSLEGLTTFWRKGSHLFSLTRTPDGMGTIREWITPETVPDVLISFHFGEITDWDIDSTGEWLVTGRDTGVYLHPMHRPTPEQARLLGRHEAKVVRVAAHPTEPWILSSDAGEVRVWSFSANSAYLERTKRTPLVAAALDPSLSWMTASPWGPNTTSEVVYVWDLKRSVDAEPFVLRNGKSLWVSAVRFYSEGSWFATANSEFGALWPFPPKHSILLRGQAPPQITVAFTPDGRGLISTSDEGAVRLWPLVPGKNERSRILLKDETASLGGNLAVAPSGTRALVRSRGDRRVFLVPLDLGPPRLMPGVTKGAGYLQALAFSLDDRLAAAADSRPAMLLVWDLEAEQMSTIDLRILDECPWGSAWTGFIWDMEFLPERRLLTVGIGGVLLWDLERGTTKRIRGCTGLEFPFTQLGTDAARERFVVVESDRSAQISTLAWFDLETRTVHEITSHGNRLSAATLDPTGTIVVTGDLDGVVRVGPITGREPHLLYGHRLEVSSVAVSPDGKWIASGSQDGTIRLWPMPEGRPFHTLPYPEMLERLRALTNLRVVADEKSETGYRTEIGPFPGWKNRPTW